MATNNAINAPIPFSATQGGSGVASPTAHGILVAEGASAFNPIVLTNGQLLIGSTGLDPVAASISAGAGISVTNGAGTITIAATASVNWNNVTSGTQALSPEQGYVTNNGASLVTYTLPVLAAFGTVISVAGFSSGGWTIAQNALQSIVFGNVSTTVGIGGSLSSTNGGDQVDLLCVVANTTWVVRDTIGNLTYV